MARSKRLVLWAVLLVSTVAFGQRPIDLEIPPSEQVSLTLTPGATVRVEGTSAWRSFASQATVVNFTGHAEAPSAEVTGLRSDLTNAYRDRYPFQVELVIPVAGLKSGDEGLDETLASTLNEKQPPKMRSTAQFLRKSPPRIRNGHQSESPAIACSMIRSKMESTDKPGSARPFFQAGKH